MSIWISFLSTLQTSFQLPNQNRIHDSPYIVIFLYDILKLTECLVSYVGYLY